MNSNACTRGLILQVASLFLAGALACSCATRSRLHDAAVRGDIERIDECVMEGSAVNEQDRLGNTPLHYAYYNGQKAAIDRLRGYGASEGVRNADGETPRDMEKLRAAETLLASGAQLLNWVGSWTDTLKGNTVYNELRAMDGAVVTKGIVKTVIKGKERLRVLFLAVKLGFPGSEERLNDALYAYGDKSMAEDYLNSGSQALHEGGRRWANSHGYSVSTGMGSHRVAWGRF